MKIARLAPLTTGEDWPGDVNWTIPRHSPNLPLR
jgi:hypothetical protein